jgi:hypothetical protein
LSGEWQHRIGVEKWVMELIVMVSGEKLGFISFSPTYRAKAGGFYQLI